jgi:importin-4
MLVIAAEPDDREIYEDEDSPVRLALVLIEALAEYLPEDHVLGPFIRRWPDMIVSSDKFQRRAALAALTGIMRASPESIHRFADPLLRDILAALKDPEDTVLRVALMALEQYTQELPDNVSKNHAVVVPPVFELLASKDLETMKVACNTLDTILEWIPQDALGPYLPTLMTTLVDILMTPIDAEVKGIVVRITHFTTEK